MRITHQEFIGLYDEHVALIYRYIFLRVNSVELAQDLTSDVFLKSWEKIQLGLKGSPEANPYIIEKPRAFFYQVARNLVIDFYRQKSRTEISLEAIEIQVPDFKNDPTKETNLALELEPVRKALAQIKDDYAEVVIWHYLDDLTVPEIADILGKSEGAVRVMLSRGLKELRQLLKSKE